MNTPNRSVRFGAGFVLLLVAACGWGAWRWTIDRIYVPEGSSLMLRYKGPLVFGSRTPAVGRFAKHDDSVTEIGVLEQMPGPGRHFYSPIWWERTLVPDVEVAPGEVGLVSSKLGDNLAPGQILVEGEIGQVQFKGDLRKPLGPGRHRINPFGYEVKIVKTESVGRGVQEKLSGWVDIPTGSVGVVTDLVNDAASRTTAGIRPKVLQPGLYLLNPKAQVVDVISVGYFEKSIVTNLLVDQSGDLRLDEAGEPMAANDDSGIRFPSSDGFTIQMDFTTIWGVMPEQAPTIVRNFGNLAAVEQKIITPQIESICRNQGSQFGAAELLAGETREKFQEQITAAFHAALDSKDISLLNGLVRYVYIPKVVREPIQKANLANELKLTSEQQELTARTEGALREAEQMVLLAVETVRAETTKKVAMLKADGDKQAAEIRAGTVKLLAAVDKQTADLERQATVLLGEAEAESQRLLAEATADKFRLAVEAFGSGRAYNQWVFATGLPKDVELKLLYAGEGTFWTDLKGISDVVMSRQLQKSATSDGAAP